VSDFELGCVVPGNSSHIGLRRYQQDAFGLSDFADTTFTPHGGYLAVVADGIGGLLHGREAAQLAVSAFLQQYAAKPAEQSIPQALDEALSAANQAVCRVAEQKHCLAWMGTTLVAAAVWNNKLYWRSVGDSHLYLCRDRRLGLLTIDHHFARTLQMQADAGIISQREAEFHPERYSLESFLGLEPLPLVDTGSAGLPLLPGDCVLLCTDGIDGVLTSDEIIACLGAEPMRAAQALCDAALAKGNPNQDNLTAVVLRLTDASQPAVRSGVTERARITRAVQFFRQFVRG